MADLASPRTSGVITPPVPENSAEQAQIKAACRRALGVDSAHNPRGKAAFAELFPGETQPQTLAQVIPFPTRTAGGVA